MGSVLAFEDNLPDITAGFSLPPARLFSSQESSQAWILEGIEF